MIKSEKISNLEEDLKYLRQLRKEKVKDLDKIDTELNWIKVQLENLTNKRY